MQSCIIRGAGALQLPPDAKIGVQELEVEASSFYQRVSVSYLAVSRMVSMQIGRSSDDEDREGRIMGGEDTLSAETATPLDLLSLFIEGGRNIDILWLVNIDLVIPVYSQIFRFTLIRIFKHF